MCCINYCDGCGNCSRCGQCCTALIPMTRKEEKRIKEYIKLHKIEPEMFQNDENINLQCCFYDRKNKICKIYEVRPHICRTFKCNRDIDELECEKINNHERSYWNRIVGGKESHLTDMRLLFYGDPRSLVANIIHAITNGTMKCDKKHLKFVKEYLKKGGQEELANCLEGVE